MSHPYSFRRLCNDIHLWLGLISGIVLFIVCLTGTIFVFHTEIEKALNPKKFYVQPAAAMLAPDALIASVEKEAHGKVLSFRIPPSDMEAWVFMVKVGKQEKKKPIAPAGKNETRAPANKMAGKKEERPEKGKAFYINPYTGMVTENGETGASKFFRTVEDIHRWFFIGKPVGKIVSGAAALIFLFITVSGLVIWFPRKIKHWKEGLKIKFSAKKKRVNHDLHRALGFYAIPVILVCALTGPSWSFEWYRKGMSNVLGDEIFKQRNEKPMTLDPIVSPGQKITTAQALAIAAPYYAGANLTIVTLPADSSKALSISKTHSGIWHMAATDKIQLNPYTGEVVKVELFKNLKLGAQIAASVRGLHMGEFWGIISKIIYFISCLFATSLPITGTIIWWNKRKKSKKKAVR